MAGVQHHHGTKLLAPLLDRWPAFGKIGWRKTPRYHRAVKEWKIRTPARSRKAPSSLCGRQLPPNLPPRPCVWRAFLSTWLSAAYLRPSELLAVRRRDLFLPRHMSWITSALVFLLENGIIPPTAESSTDVSCSIFRGWVDDQGPPVCGKGSSSPASLGFRLPSNLKRNPTCRAGSWHLHIDDVPDQTFRRQH